MISPSLLALALLGGPQDTAPGAARVLEIGDSSVGELPATTGGESTPPAARYRFAPEDSGPWTLRIGTFDFVPRIETGDGGGARSPASVRLREYSLAWLVVEGPKAPSSVDVVSEDGRGGRFVLSASAGRHDLGSDRLGQMRALIEDCGPLATAEAARGDRARSTTLRDLASRAALQIGDGVAAQAMAEGQVRDAEAGSLREALVQGRLNLGASLRLVGRPEEAEQLLAAALPEAEAILGATAEGPEEDLWVVRMLYAYDALGDLRSERSGPRAALSAYRRALELARRSRVQDNAPKACTKLAAALDETGEPAEADAVIEEAIAAVERPGIGSRVFAGVLSAAATAQLRRGDYARARETCERALAVEPPPDVRIALLGTIASAWIEEGRYERAETVLEEIELKSEELGVRRYAIPTLLNRASLAIRLGDGPGAQEHLEEALRLQEASGSIQHRVEILTNLAIVLEDERPEEALLRYEQAIEACETTGNVLVEAQVLTDLARYHARTERAATALEEVRHAEDLATVSGGERILAAARAAEGFIHLLLGEPAAARSATEAAAETMRKLGEVDAEIDTQETLARIALSTGDLAAAEAAEDAAEKLLDELADGSLDRFGTIALRSRFLGKDRGATDWSAVAQDIAAARVRSATTDSERDRAADEGWRSAQRWKARQLLQGIPGGPGGGKNPDEGAIGTERMPRIGDRSAVIEYVRGLDRLYAYVACRNGTELVDLGPCEPIHELALRFVSRISGGWARPKDLADPSFRLYERLVAPVLDHLPAGTTRWTIVPEEDLATVPFEALVTSLPGTSEVGPDFENLDYLIDSVEIAYAPSSAVLARLQERKRREEPRRFLVLGDPVYRPELNRLDTVAAAGSPRRTWIDLERLPATREETREIAQLLILSDDGSTDAERRKLLELAYRRSGSLSSRRFDLRLGAEAKVSTLPSDLSAYTNLHFAVHGHVDARDPRHSGLVLSWEPGSGGLLALEDLLATRIDADLVILSACDTATGPIVRGEGVQSLANAVLESGARSVVASLWKVEDRDAAEIMKALYRSYLEDGSEPGRALRQAKIDYRQGHRPRGTAPGSGSASPYSWAAFVYVGPFME